MEGEEEKNTRKTGIDGKQFNRKYGERVSGTVVGDHAIDREYVACSKSLVGCICIAEGVSGKFIGDGSFDVFLVS